MAALTLLVGGCGDAGEEPPTPEASSSSVPTTATPSPSPADPSESPSDGAVPTDPDVAPGTRALPPRPAYSDDRAGRQAFAEFVVARWSYALLTNDADAVVDLSGRTRCLGCRELAAELGRRIKEQWYVDFPGADITRLKIARTGEDTWRANARVDIPASRSFYEDGTFRNDSPAHPDSLFVVDLASTGKRYVLLGFRVR